MINRLETGLFTLILLSGCISKARTVDSSNALDDSVSPVTRLFHRSYTVDEVVRYKMTGENQVDSTTHTYSLTSVGTVHEQAAGVFVENTTWNQFVRDDQPVVLDATSLAFRQIVSLDPNFDMSVAAPETGRIDHGLGVAAEDFFNFYVDLWATGKFSLVQAGDEISFDGPVVSFLGGAGQNVFRFHYLVEKVDATAQEAVLKVEHLPPAVQHLSLLDERVGGRRFTK